MGDGGWAGGDWLPLRPGRRGQVKAWSDAERLQPENFAMNPQNEEPP